MSPHPPCTPPGPFARPVAAGDIVWSCRTCAADETCVVCGDCFDPKKHEGHEVFFYHAAEDGTGCCDCGDEGAWCKEGFCDRHAAGLEHDPLESFPPSFERT